MIDMYKKKKTSKSRKKGKRQSKKINPHTSHETSFQKSGYSTLNLQQSNNCDTSAARNEGKPTVCLFHNPLISKNGWEQVKKTFKWKESISPKDMTRCIGTLFIVFHSLVLAVIGIAGLIREDKADIINVFSHTASLANGIYDLIKYLDDVNALFSSIFDIRDKSIVRYCADLLFKRLVIKGFQLAGLFYQFKNGEKSKLAFSLELLSFLLHPVGNFLLLLGRAERVKRATSSVNDR
ncbi:hypothetical protein BZL39_M00130 [Zygosaccharomyces parabailii]|nr:hypothetical protein BZL39_M00130 [Zygosaccharomyces parabailii]CDH13843.1 uncharacterized protein ZBAI_05629 [Zygosaccharomyces bailii ISA1307]